MDKFHLSARNLLTAVETWMRLACYLSPTDSSTKASGFSSTAYLSKLKNPKVKMPFLMGARVTLNVVKIASAVSLTHRDVGNANARRSLFQMGRIACQDQVCITDIYLRILSINLYHSSMFCLIFRCWMRYQKRLSH